MKQSSGRTKSSVSWSEPPEPRPRSPSVPSDSAPPQPVKSPSLTSANQKIHHQSYSWLKKRKKNVEYKVSLTISSTSSFLMVTLANSFSLQKGKQGNNVHTLKLCQFASLQEKYIGSHLSCLAFCSRDLLSPMTDMAWNQHRQLWAYLSKNRVACDRKSLIKLVTKCIHHRYPINSTNRFISNWRLPYYRQMFHRDAVNETNIQKCKTYIFLLNLFMYPHTNQERSLIFLEIQYF